MDPKRPSYPRTVWWTMQGLTEPFNTVRCCNFTGKKAWSVYSLPDNGLFPKNWTIFATKPSVWPSNTLKTVDLGYRSSLSVAWMVRFWSKSFKNPTVHKTSLVQGSLSLLTVYTHKVPLCLCSVVCSLNQVRLSTARYRVFGARTTPWTVSRLQDANFSPSGCLRWHATLNFQGQQTWNPSW